LGWDFWDVTTCILQSALLQPWAWTCRLSALSLPIAQSGELGDLVVGNCSTEQWSPPWSTLHRGRGLVCRDLRYEAPHVIRPSPLIVLRVLEVGLSAGALGWVFAGEERHRFLLGHCHCRYPGERRVGSVGWLIDI
jgi:hypothetical protein